MLHNYHKLNLMRALQPRHTGFHSLSLIGFCVCAVILSSGCAQPNTSFLAPFSQTFSQPNAAPGAEELRIEQDLQRREAAQQSIVSAASNRSPIASAPGLTALTGSDSSWKPGSSPDYVPSPPSINPPTPGLEQQRYQAAQVAFQQPMNRVYSNSPPQSMGTVQAPGFLPAPRLPARQNWNNQLNGGPIQPQDLGPQSQAIINRQATVNRQSQAPINPPPNQIDSPVPQSAAELPRQTREPAEQQGARLMDQMINERQLPLRPSATGHYARGINFGGDDLRSPGTTATEIVYQLMAEIASMKTQLGDCQSKIELQAKELEIQTATLDNYRDQLLKSAQLEEQLRRKIATLNVKVQDLEKEKTDIEANADKALKEIETTLDAMLIQSMPKKQ